MQIINKQICVNICIQITEMIKLIIVSNQDIKLATHRVDYKVPNNNVVKIQTIYI